MIGSHNSAIAFEGTARIATGTVASVARAVRERLAENANISILVLDAQTSAIIDLDLRGTAAEGEQRYSSIDHDRDSNEADQSDDSDSGSSPTGSKSRARGRPKLGVVPREITLLPRHWSWLAAQPGGASVTLRRLVDHARTAGVDKDRARVATDATYRFLTHLAGNEIGFEEATRALFAGERERFLMRISQWPEDVREHAQRLAEPSFAVAAPS